MYDYFVFQSVFFFLKKKKRISSFSSPPLFSSLLFASLFSSLLLSLLLSCLSSYMSPSPLFLSPSPLSSLVTFSSFSFSLFRLLFSLSVFFLCLLSPCVGGVCVVVCVVMCVVVCVCVCGVVWCAVWCGTLKTPCVDSKTPPCVDSKRPRVCRQHTHMLFSMCAWCRYTRGRFECTHGERFKSTHGGHARMVITCFRGSPKKLLDLFHVQV